MEYYKSTSHNSYTQPTQRHNDRNSLAQSTYVFLYTLFVCRDEWQNSKKNLEATSETAINTQLKQGGFSNSLDSLTLTDVCGHSASGSTDLFLLLHKRQSTMNSLIHFKMKLLSKLNDFEWNFQEWHRIVLFLSKGWSNNFLFTAFRREKQLTTDKCSSLHSCFI